MADGPELSPLDRRNDETGPLIKYMKFGRYAALITGIIYGSTRLNRLKAKEVGIQEHENKLRAIRDARLKEEKIAFEAAEMNALAKEAGVKT